MTNKINLIISGFLLLIIIILKIIIIKRHSNIKKTELLKKAKKLNILLYLLSFLIFIIYIVISLITKEITNFKETITIIVNSLSISLLIIPLSINTLYYTSFKDEEKINRTKTIITNIFDIKYIRKFNKAGINVIIITKEELDTKIKQINEDEIDSNLLRKNLIIRSTNKKIIDKYLDKDLTYYEFKDLDDAYNKIYNTRGVHDNYIRTIKYNITTYLPLVLSFIVLCLMGFPITYNILLVLLLKIYTILNSEFIYKKMSYDTDIMKRYPKPLNVFIGTQEVLISIIISFCISFTLTIPYMYVLSQGGSIEFANTLFILIFIYINVFMTLSYISESMLLKNIIKVFKSLRLIIYILGSISITFIFYYSSYFKTRNIGIHNYLGSLAFALIPVLLYELTKLARYTTTKRRKRK